MADEYQVVVIGSGAAGCAAALAAAEAGATVGMVRGAPGATALSSGAVDLGAGPAERPGDAWAGRPSLAETYASNRRRGPHPLDIASVDAAGAQAALAALAARLDCLEARSLEEPLLVLPTDLGTFKSTALASPWAAPGHLPGLAGKRVGVAGIAGHPGQQQHLACGLLGALARRGGVELELIPLQLPLLRLRGEELAGPVDLARLVERPDTLERVADWLGRQARELALDHLLLPPLMGLHGWPGVRDRITAEAPASELLAAASPSLPGLRLAAALEGLIAGAGIVQIKGRAACLELEGEAVSAATLADGRSLQGDAFVLCTGKFIGGGLCHDPAGLATLREPLLDLPVWIGRQGPDSRSPGKYMAREAAGPHRLLTAGLRVDSRLRPLDRGAAAAAPNLFAAGSVIGGYDYISGRDGLGTALITGGLAGAGAAREAGR